MADTKEKSLEKQTGGVAVKWILIIIALLWLITHKSTIKTFWEDLKPQTVTDHVEMVELKVGEVSREVRTDPKKEWLDFDLMNSNLSWYVIPNGKMEDKILLKPGGPINKIGRGYWKLQFMLANDVSVDSTVSVHHIPK